MSFTKQTIKKFTINRKEHHLVLMSSKGNAKENELTLSFEYLRVFTPAKKITKGQPELICHKKSVVINAIEPVGKYGFRLLFDDGHSAIYAEDYFNELASNHHSYWQQYLAQLQQSGHSRETMIDITQL